MPFARSILAALFLSLIAPVVATAAEPVTQKLTAHGDGVARHNAPVTARIDAKLPISGVMPATLTTDDGFDVPAQVQRAEDDVIVRWVEPSLSADVSKTYTLTVGYGKTHPASFRFETGDGFRDLLLGERPVYRHMNKYDPADRESTYKPFYHVYGLHGEGFITKGAGGKYPHHRGLFFGFKTPHGDFWHCNKGESQQHKTHVAEREILGPIASRGVSVTEWIDKDGKPVVRDTQEVTAWDAGTGRLILDFDITVESLTGQVVPIGGDAHHAGFHFRAAQEVADVPATQKTGGGTVYTRPAGAKLVKDDIWEDCAWVDCAFDVKGNHYGVTHMDAPSNPRPTTYSSRGYGRFGTYFAADVAPDKPLKLRFRIAVRDAGAGGDVSLERLEAAYQDFAKPIRVSVAQ